MYNYILILEKTNEQLSHWVSVSNWTIAILGVFIALIAIFVGLALFKNSRDQKKQTEEFFDKLKARYEEEVKLANKRYQESKDTFNKLIKEKHCTNLVLLVFIQVVTQLHNLKIKLFRFL